MPDEPHIIIYGNLVYGFAFVGPFVSATEAIAYGRDNEEGEAWHIAELEPVPSADY